MKNFVTMLLCMSLASSAYAEKAPEWCAPQMSDLSVACLAEDASSGSNVLFPLPCLLGERALIRGKVTAFCSYDTVTITATPHQPDEGYAVQPATPRRKRFKAFEGGTLPFAIVVNPYLNLEDGVRDIPIVLGATSSYDSDRSRVTILVPWDTNAPEF